MYRIELSPGEETAFRTIEELAVAIRRKVVTSRARIYHNATSKWLPIQFHPHYKIALTMPLTQADLVAGPAVAPLSTLKLGDPQAQLTPPAPSNRESATQAALAAWPEPKPSSAPTPQSRAPAQRNASPVPQEPIMLGTPAPEPRVVAQPRTMQARSIAEERRVIEPQKAAVPPRLPAPARIPAPPRLSEPLAWVQPTKSARRRRKPQRTLRVALVGAVLLACAHLVLSGASARSSTMAARIRTPRQLISAPTEALKDVAPRTVAAVMPMLQSIPVPGLNPASGPRTNSAAPANSTQRSRPIITRPVARVVEPEPLPAPEPEIEAAPDAAPVTIGVPPHPASLTPQVVDSTGKKSMKRILRTIDGSATAESKPSQR